MNLRFVETFVWVARLQSVTRTAEKLSLTQSAVSNRIAMLESELGVALVDRRDRQFRLTREGSRFLDHAEHLLSIQHRLKRDLGGQGPAPISLRLGVIETVSHAWLIPLMESLKAQKPQIEYELNVEMTPVLHQQFRRGGLDLLFTAEAVSGKGAVNERLPPLEMVFVGPPALRDRRRLSVEDLLAFELLTFQRHSQPHDALSHALASHGVSDKRLHSISSISAMVKLVKSGFGIATLPRAALAPMLDDQELFVLDTAVELKPLPLVASHLGQPASAALEEIIAAALAFARKAMR